jgi:hypothetical protein
MYHALQLGDKYRKLGGEQLQGNYMGVKRRILLKWILSKLVVGFR